MTNSVNISVSGGTASLGNIVQGNGNQTTAANSVSVVEQGYQQACAAISGLGRELQLPSNHVNGVIEQLEKLKIECEAPVPALDTGAAIFKSIRENYSWAYPLFKDFLAVAWPAILSLAAV